MKSLPLATYGDYKHEDDLKYLSELASEYARLHWRKYEDQIANFPTEEGHAPTSKEDMIFTITRQFLEWCATKDE